MNEENPNEMHADVKYWLDEISSSRKRERDYRKDGLRILDIYSGKKKEDIPFNILFSNTETLKPALYSTVPRPVVERRFKDEDPVGKAAAEAGQRLLEFLLDTSIDGYETFDDGMNAATLDTTLVGRGVTCVKYDADVVDVEDTPYKNSELVCLDSQMWTRVYFGYAHKWSKVPWIAYETYLDEDECKKLFGEEIAKKIVYTTGEEADTDDEDFLGKDEEEREIGERKTALIYQIWDRAGGKVVRYISPQFKENILKNEDDPLGLTGFFNCPKPMRFVDKPNDFTPVASYTLYENQAKELNDLTRRISKIIRAIRAKGAYDQALGDDIKNLMDADEGDLIPVDVAAASAGEKGLDSAVWFWPVDKLIIVLRELYQARENCKQVIFEIMGLADIMRGASVASETLGAQQIKQTWGQLRLKDSQKEVQRYAKDLLRLMLEVAAQKFSVSTWAQMTGLPFVTKQENDKAQKLMQTAQQMAAKYQQQAQIQAQQTGQPPQPPQVPPEIQQQVQQAQATLQKPVWEDILKLLKNDLQRAYRIDIETNSTIEAEATEDQKNIADVMNALAQYLNGVAPLVLQGALPFEAAQAMMMAIIRRFRFGSEIEDFIKQMKPPQPPPDAAGQMAKVQAAQQKLQSDTQSAQEKLQFEAEKKQMEFQQHVDKQSKLADEREIALQIKEANFNLAQQLAEKDRAHYEQLHNVTKQAESSMMMAEVKSTLGAHKQGVQSILDKHSAKIDLMKTELQESTKVLVAQINAKSKLDTAGIAAEAAADKEVESDLNANS